MFSPSSTLKSLILTNFEMSLELNKFSFEPVSAFLKIGLVNELQLKFVQEIVDWIHFCYDSCQKPSDYKANVGPFLGIFPTQVTFEEEGEVTFSIDCFDGTWSRSWKSWFLSVEDI